MLSEESKYFLAPMKDIMFKIKVLSIFTWLKMHWQSNLYNLNCYYVSQHRISILDIKDFSGTSLKLKGLILAIHGCILCAGNAFAGK